MTRTIYQLSRGHWSIDIGMKSQDANLSLFSISPTFRNIHNRSLRTGNIDDISENDYEVCVDIDMHSVNLPSIWNWAMICESAERYKKIVGDNNA